VLSFDVSFEHCAGIVLEEFFAIGVASAALDSG
jgi:hypothetical protein